MKLIIMRHAITLDNERGIAQGQLDGKLSETGIKQAKLAAERLKHEKIDKIIVSNLGRTKETAEPIIKFHPEAEVIYENKIKEINLGTLEGRPSAELDAEYKKNEHIFFDFKVHGGESISEMHKRVADFIDELIADKTNKGKTILIISHGGTIGNMILHLKKISKENAKAAFHTYFPKNTALTFVDIKDDGNHEIKLMNCIKHLD
jgi:alpha-ribazole phosphatase